MKKVLFIDRDGTLIKESFEDEQVDSLEKLEFIPQVFQALNLVVRNLDFELVIVTNQDGLGTDSFPEDTFWPAQNRMMETLAGEGITFAAVHIDKTFESENAPTRKPRPIADRDYKIDCTDSHRGLFLCTRATATEGSRPFSSSPERDTP